MDNELVLLDRFGCCLDAYNLKKDIDNPNDMTVKKLHSKYVFVGYSFNNILKYDISHNFEYIRTKYKKLDRTFNA